MCILGSYFWGDSLEAVERFMNCKRCDKEHLGVAGLLFREYTKTSSAHKLHDKTQYAALCADCIRELKDVSTTDSNVCSVSV